MYRLMTKTEDLDPRSHGKFESVSTLGTTHGYEDDRLPLPRGREGSQCGTVERLFSNRDRIHRWTTTDDSKFNEKEHIIYILEFKRVSDTGEKYMSGPRPRH